MRQRKTSECGSEGKVGRGKARDRQWLWRLHGREGGKCVTVRAGCPSEKQMQTFGFDSCEPSKGN